MIKLPYPDDFHLRAALGWLMLENTGEAAVEFRKIRGEHTRHPDWLQVRCRLLIAERRWTEALDVSARQLWLAPDRPHGWINRAYCLHELKRTREARRTLVPAAKRFPQHDLIAFNLACYCCHLDRFGEALFWLNRTAALLAPREREGKSPNASLKNGAMQ